MHNAFLKGSGILSPQETNRKDKISIDNFFISAIRFVYFNSSFISSTAMSTVISPAAYGAISYLL